MVLFIDPFIALRMGQNGPEAEGGKAVQAVPDVGVIFFREKFHQTVGGTGQRHQLSRCQKFLDPMTVKKLAARI